jgi:hypothetical protein
MKTLECSSKGDKRFSAFYACVSIKGVEKSIENWYQLAKRDAYGNVPGKGKKVAYMINPFNGNKLPANCLSDFYKCLWIRYFTANPDLLEYAKGFDNFNDMFRGKCVNCQADVIRECVKDFDGLKKKLMTSDFYKDCTYKVKE